MEGEPLLQLGMRNVPTAMTVYRGLRVGNNKHLQAFVRNARTKFEKGTELCLGTSTSLPQGGRGIPLQKWEEPDDCNTRRIRGGHQGLVCVCD